MGRAYQSWGNYPKATQTIQNIYWRNQSLPSLGNTILPYGQGRSYGDCCLNNGGTLLDTESLDHFLTFDPHSGTLQCEAGVTLSEILKLVIPQGWMLPVVPGTRFVSVGGAIANDIHGKNHHRHGSFGCHVRRFELLRSDGGRILCSKNENLDWYQATIGGLGLTGLVLWADLQLKKIPGPFIMSRTTKVLGVDDCLARLEESDKSWEYTAAWLDGLRRDSSSWRGILFQGNHCDSPALPHSPLPLFRKSDVSIPFEMPECILNKSMIRLFNLLYFLKNSQQLSDKTILLDRFLFPLDFLKNWNRIYGKRGFLQYQCVLPIKDGAEAIKEMFSHITRSGKLPYLLILKRFGEEKSGGMLSFPREGITMAVDFPNHGEDTFNLLMDLDTIVLKAKGAVYPAKDARMSAKSFQAFFPQWENFSLFIDPKFSSSFWRRVTENIPGSNG